MTSASLSLSNRLANRKKYIARTLWSSIIAFVLMVIYYVLGTTVMVSRSVSYGITYHQSPEVLFHEKLDAVSRVLGLEQFGWILVALIAVAFAFQGFSYVFDTSKLDFYLSQPTTRAGRIRKNYVNAIFTFLLMYVVVNAIALLVAAFMGAVNGALIVSVLIEIVRSLVLFITVYNITVLAIMLCGNFLISTLVLAFFAAISLTFGYVIDYYKRIFFATYSDYGKINIWGSPVYDRLSAGEELLRFKRDTSFEYNFASLKECFYLFIKYDLDILVAGIIAFVFVIIFSKYRRAEHAGKAIVYKPFRWLVKIISCVLVGLVGGFIFYEMNNYIWNDSKFYASMFLIILLGTLLAGCAIEAILDGNIRSLFKGKAQTVMALALVSLIFVIYKGDLLGYNSYIPNPSKVESCAFLSDGYEYRMYTEGMHSYYDNTSEKFMYITDIENFNKVVKRGLETEVEAVKRDQNGDYRDLGWNEQILYRLKNGKEVYRSICIPYDIDREALSAIIDSQEYREGYFMVYHDESLKEFDALNENSRSVIYTSFSGEESTSALPYAEISDAYKKDVEKYFNFEMASQNAPIGQIEYNCSSIDGYSSCTLNVYDCYEETIALLKKYEIYREGDINIDDVRSVEVTNFYPGYDLEKQDINDIDENVASKSFVYTEKDQIRDIIGNVICNDFYSRWYHRDEYINDQFSVVVNMSSSGRYSGEYSRYYSFEMGKVPDFVWSDTN